MKSSSTFFNIFLVLLLAYFFIVIFLFFYQRKLLYHPGENNYLDDASLNHQIEKVGPLFGKPDWFMGVMLHRDSKLNVVDSAKWVMPEKYDENLAESLNYRYLIMLGESEWGLASEKLVNTVNLTIDDVKWRESTGKRPWLAGMVKEKMCALVDVEELISMLNKGLGSNDQTP